MTYVIKNWPRATPLNIITPMEIKPSGCNVHCVNTQMKILLANGKKGLRGAPAGRGDAAAADEVDEGDGSCGHEVPGVVLSSLHTENHTLLGTTPRSRCYSLHFTDAETETQSLKDVPRGTRSTEGRGVKRAPSGSRAQTRNRACYRRPVLLENYCGLRSGGAARRKRNHGTTWYKSKNIMGLCVYAEWPTCFCTCRFIYTEPAKWGWWQTCQTLASTPPLYREKRELQGLMGLPIARDDIRARVQIPFFYPLAPCGRQNGSPKMSTP